MLTVPFLLYTNQIYLYTILYTRKSVYPGSLYTIFYCIPNIPVLPGSLYTTVYLYTTFLKMFCILCIPCILRRAWCYCILCIPALSAPRACDSWLGPIPGSRLLGQVPPTPPACSYSVSSVCRQFRQYKGS